MWSMIGAGAVGAVSAIELLRDGHRVTVIEPGDAGRPAGRELRQCRLALDPLGDPSGWSRRLETGSELSAGSTGSAGGALELPAEGTAVAGASICSRAGPNSGSRRRRVRCARLLVDAPPLHKKLADEAGVGRSDRAPRCHARLSFVARPSTATRWDGGSASVSASTWLELSADEMRQREPDLHPRYQLRRAWWRKPAAAAIPAAMSPGLRTHALARWREVRRAPRRRASSSSGNNLRGGRHRQRRGRLRCRGGRRRRAFRNRSRPRSAIRLPLETERGYHVMIEESGIGPRTSMMASDAKMVVNWTDKGLRAAGTGRDRGARGRAELETRRNPARSSCSACSRNCRRIFRRSASRPGSVTVPACRTDGRAWGMPAPRATSSMPSATAMSAWSARPAPGGWWRSCSSGSEPEIPVTPFDP